jgi:cellulose synthase/poly-beta-1,6-N-acetylglucosamine synthase-like glycosyltransferase
LVQTISAHPIREGWRQYEAWLNGRRSNRDIVRDLYVESPLAHPSVLIRRTALEAVGGYRVFDGPEDYDLWLRMAAAGWELAKVPAVLLSWRDHPTRLTRTDPRYRPEAFIRLKAHHLARGPLGAGGRPTWIWGAGRYGRLLARALEPEGIRPEAFIDIDPKKIGRTRRGRPVVAPGGLLQQPTAMVLAAVPVPGARALIRRRLNRMGWVETRDYWCCA